MTVSNPPECRIVVSIVNIVDTIKLELAPPEKSEKPTEKSPNRENSSKHSMSTEQPLNFVPIFCLAGDLLTTTRWWPAPGAAPRQLKLSINPYGHFETSRRFVDSSSIDQDAPSG